jgi:hypothetical protein
MPFEYYIRKAHLVCGYEDSLCGIEDSPDWIEVLTDQKDDQRSHQCHNVRDFTPIDAPQPE